MAARSLANDAAAATEKTIVYAGMNTNVSTSANSSVTAPGPENCWVVSRECANQVSIAASARSGNARSRSEYAVSPGRCIAASSDCS